jgi:hypothetical protein
MWSQLCPVPLRVDVCAAYATVAPTRGARNLLHGRWTLKQTNVREVSSACGCKLQSPSHILITVYPPKRFQSAQSYMIEPESVAVVCLFVDVRFTFNGLCEKPIRLRQDVPNLI